MKHRDLIRALEKLGYVQDRSTGRHEVYIKQGCEPIPVPRHKEINEITAKAILRKAEKQ